MAARYSPPRTMPPVGHPSGVVRTSETRVPAFGAAGVGAQCDNPAMPRLISAPSRITAAGEPPKTIDEYVGRVNSGDAVVSVAHMRSPSGWSEPGQRPDFDEYTLVLRGALLVEHESGTLEVAAGQAVHTAPGEWIRYSSPGPDGAEYVAVCLPAFAPDTVNRDED